MRLRYWECPAEWISWTEALFSLELASRFTWRKQFPLNKEEYYEHTLIFPSCTENPRLAAGVRRGRSVQVHFVMGRCRQTTRSKKGCRERNQVLLAEDTGPSPGATPPGSGPPCGNLCQTFIRGAVRADHGSWHSLCVDVNRNLAGRTALPAVGCTDAVLREGQKPTAPRSSGACGWAQERARAARPPRRGPGHRSSAEGAGTLGTRSSFRD